MNIRGIIEISQLGEFETCKSLSSLLTTELITQEKRLEHRPVEDAGDEPSLSPGFLQKLTRRGIGSFIVHFLAFIVLLLFTMKIHGANPLISETLQFYNQFRAENRLVQVRRAIHSYYYRTGDPPRSLGKLVDNGYLKSGWASKRFEGTLELRIVEGQERIFLTLDVE